MAMRLLLVVLLFSAAQAHWGGHEVIITSPQQMEMVGTTQAVCAADTARLCPDAIKAELEHEHEMQQQMAHHGHHSCHMRMLRLGMMLFPGFFFHKHMMWMHEHHMEPELSPGLMLGFGEQVNRCLLSKFRDASPPCKAAIIEAQTLAWQASEVVAEVMPHVHHGHHGHGHGVHHKYRKIFALSVVSCLLLSIIMMFIMGVRSSKTIDWRKRRTQLRKIMNAIRGDAELTARIESVTGEALPEPIADRKSGCMCARLLSALVFSVMLGLAGAAPLLVLWAFAFWLGYILGLCCCRRRTDVTPPARAVQGTAPPSYKDIECASVAPPTYTPRTASNSYVHLKDESDAHPSVVLGTHVSV